MGHDVTVWLPFAVCVCVRGCAQPANDWESRLNCKNHAPSTGEGNSAPTVSGAAATPTNDAPSGKRRAANVTMPRGDAKVGPVGVCKAVVGWSTPEHQTVVAGCPPPSKNARVGAPVGLWEEHVPADDAVLHVDSVDGVEDTSRGLLMSAEIDLVSLAPG